MIDWNAISVDLAAIIVELKFAKSKSEARRMITQGAVYLNNTKIIDPFARLSSLDGRFIIVEDAKHYEPATP